MRIMLKRKDKNEIHLENLAYVLYMPILIDLLNVILNQLSLKVTSLVTMCIYIISLIIIMYRERKSIKLNDIIILLLVYLIFIFNYFVFNDTREYFFNDDMLIVLLFFFPILIISMRKIRNWELFFSKMKKMSIISILTGLFILLFLDYQQYLVYMGFSYALLPFICIMYHEYRTSHNKKDLVIFICGILTILIFGARAAVLFLVVYIIIFEILRTDKKKKYKLATLVFLLFFSIMTFIYSDQILAKLQDIPMLNDSRFLTEISKGKLFESKTRNVLYDNCVDRINTVGFEITGFFGDRKYCGIFPYPHNIMYELIMSFGWGLGSIIIALFVFLIIRLLLQKEERDITILIIISFLTRYIISGSYLIEGRFWIALVLLLVILRTINNRNYFIKNNSANRIKRRNIYNK